MKPLFIAFEGIDGAGTTTQCERLCARLRLEGHDVVQTREPGGTEACERIRDLVLDPALKSLDAVTELFLMGASRRQHVAELIEPSLRSGKPVISDRYAQSSVAYQGIGRGLGVDLVSRINKIATGGLTASLAPHYQCVGVDPFAGAIKLARELYPECKFEVSSASDALAQYSSSASIYLLLDILEHISEDADFLGEVITSIARGQVISG